MKKKLNFRGDRLTESFFDGGGVWWCRRLKTKLLQYDEGSVTNANEVFRIGVVLVATLAAEYQSK